MENSIQIVGQNLKMSFFESIVGVVTGYIMTVLMQYLLYPLFGINIPTRDALWISLFIVCIAFFKNFAVRRAFNAVQLKVSNFK